MIDSGLKAVVRSKVVRVLFLTMGSTITAPAKVAYLYSDSLAFRSIYIFVGAYGVLEYDLKTSAVATLLILALYDAMRGGADDPYRPFFGRSFQRSDQDR